MTGFCNGDIVKTLKLNLKTYLRFLSVKGQELKGNAVKIRSSSSATVRRTKAYVGAYLCKRSPLSNKAWEGESCRVNSSQETCANIGKVLFGGKRSSALSGKKTFLFAFMSRLLNEPPKRWLFFCVQYPSEDEGSCIDHLINKREEGKNEKI